MSRSRTTTVGEGAAPRSGADLYRMRREPTHPGEVFLEEFLKPRGYGAQGAAADAMGMSRNRLNEIVSKKRGVSAETALLFGALTGTDARMWLTMQADYDLWHALQATRDRLAEVRARATAARSEDV